MALALRKTDEARLTNNSEHPLTSAKSPHLRFPSFTFFILAVTLNLFLFNMEFKLLRANGISKECRGALSHSNTLNDNGAVSPRETFLSALGPLAEFVDAARAPLL